MMGLDGFCPAHWFPLEPIFLILNKYPIHIYSYSIYIYISIQTPLFVFFVAKSQWFPLASPGVAGSDCCCRTPNDLLPRRLGNCQYAEGVAVDPKVGWRTLAVVPSIFSFLDVFGFIKLSN